MQIDHFRRGMVVAAGIATIAGIIELRANVTARAELEELLRGRSDITVGWVWADPLGRQVTLGDVSLSGATRVTVGRITIPMPGESLSPISPAAASPFDDAPTETKPTEPPASAPPTSPVAPPSTPSPKPSVAGVASAENVTITNGTTVYHIKRVELAGTSLSSADVAKLLDSASGEPFEARLNKLTATAVVIPEVLADDTTAGSERHAAITQILLSDVKNGRIGAGTASGVTFSAKTGDEDTSGHTGAIQVSGIDLPQIVHVFGSVRSDDAEPIRPLYDAISVTETEVKNAKKQSTVTLGSLKATGVKARALKTDFITASKAGTETLSDTEKAAVYDDMRHSFVIGSVEATSLSARGDSADGPNTFSLAKISMRDFADGKLGNFGAEGLRFDGPNVKLALGSFDAGPFVLPPPKTGTSPAASNAMMPTAGRADMRQLDVNMITPDKDGGPPTHVQFAIGHSAVASDGESGDIPKTTRVTVENITFDVPADAGKAQPLSEMGYHHIDLSAALASTYDSGSHELKIENFSISGVQMGTIALGLDLANVTKGIVSQNQEIAKAAALSILAKGLTLDVANGGLVDRAIVWKAKQDSMDVDKEKAFLVDFFGDKLPASLGGSANAKLVGSAIAKFVTDPKNLHIGIVSQSGLGVGSMALLSDPGLLIDTLEVKASANQ